MSTDPTGAAAPGTHNGSSSSGAIAQGHDREHDQSHSPSRDQSPVDTDSSSIAVANPIDTARPNPPSKPTGLHSPPDSNNVDDGSTDSELSDFDESIANADDAQFDSPPRSQPATATAAAAAAVDDDDPAAPAPASTLRGGDASTEQSDQVPMPDEDEDIGEVVPDHWSGTVPVFKPPMHQFKDFKKFVRYSRGHIGRPSHVDPK